MLIFASCKKDEVAPRTPAAGFMGFNLALDKPLVGFSLSGHPISNSGLEFPAFTGNYLPIFPGARELKAYDFNSNSTIATSNETFVDSMYYSAFLVGNNGTYRNLVVQDNYDAVTPVSGKAWVRYVNAIPDSSTSTVMMGETSASAKYGNVSAFEQVNSGDLEVSVKNGSTIDAGRTIAVEENRIYTILLVGLPNQTDTTRNVAIRYIQNGTAAN
jgi:hypothetical protein